MGLYGSPDLNDSNARLSRRKPRGLRRAWWRGFIAGYTVGALAIVVALMVLGHVLGGR